MIVKFERTIVDERYIHEAVLGARLSYGSGARSDTTYDEATRTLTIGPEDRKLASKLVKAGRGHSKFLRGIPVSVMLTATTIWWRQLDQHKVGVTTNSFSLMHRAANKGEFTADDFGGDNASPEFFQQLDALNTSFRRWKEADSKRRGEVWESVVDKVPANFLYTRQMVTNYEALRGMYFQRRGHRWGEWAEFLDWARDLPLAKLLIMPEDDTSEY